MQTRHQAASGRSGPACDLPDSVQEHLLSLLAAEHAGLDDRAWNNFPYASSHAWLAAAQRVSRHWRACLQAHPGFLRRQRLEILARASRLHDYAHLMVSRVPRATRLRGVPRRITLTFPPQRRLECATGTPTPAALHDLPDKCLVLTVDSAALTAPLLLSLLLDQAQLDAAGAAAYVVRAAAPRSQQRQRQQGAAADPAVPGVLLQDLARSLLLEGAHQDWPFRDLAAAAGSSADALVRATLIAVQQQATAAAAAAAPAGTLGAQHTLPGARGGSCSSPPADLAPLQAHTRMEVYADGVYFVSTRLMMCRRQPSPA